MDFVAAVAVFFAAADLGSDDWHRRESAEHRLRSAGSLAWPLLLAASASDDPEVRDRCWRLLAPYRDWRLTERAWAVIHDPWPPRAVDYWSDRQLRRRVLKLATDHGWQWHGAYYSDPLSDDIDSWLTAAETAVVLASVRRFFGGEKPWWPFDH